MAILTIKTGGRGRPLTIDIEKTLEQFVTKLPQAKERLQEIRQKSSGQRAEAILGSETTLPKGIQATADVLEALQRGQKIDYATAKELKQNLKTVTQLASKQERVHGRALASSLLKQYEQDLAYQAKYASKTAKKIYKQLGENVKQLTPRQQQKFFTSRSYQDVKTNRKDYKRVVEWAENDLANNGVDTQLTGEEALAYVELHKQGEFIESLEELQF